ncbi:hypothetical protein CgunFtcFv8_018234 [Champsocephalus gunnari]|uniref:Uncharacterized protein n=1 Tax=Champsocephalus gunnari TaxID=52237 RepID=A0AAN8DPT6_CHAGU|nr:hypothetical protein CgunFtcFv8_018234 [Champsocephalus gunnari]
MQYVEGKEGHDPASVTPSDITATVGPQTFALPLSIRSNPAACWTSHTACHKYCRQTTRALPFPWPHPAACQSANPSHCWPRLNACHTGWSGCVCPPDNDNAYRVQSCILGEVDAIQAQGDRRALGSRSQSVPGSEAAVVHVLWPTHPGA